MSANSYISDPDAMLALLRDCVRSDASQERLAALRQLIQDSGIGNRVTWMGDRRLANVRKEIAGHLLGSLYGAKSQLEVFLERINRSYVPPNEYFSEFLKLLGVTTTEESKSASIKSQDFLSLLRDCVRSDANENRVGELRQLLEAFEVSDQIARLRERISPLEKFLNAADAGRYTKEKYYSEFVQLLENQIKKERRRENPGAELAGTISKAIDDLVRDVRAIRCERDGVKLLRLIETPAEAEPASIEQLDAAFKTALGYKEQKQSVTRAKIREILLQVGKALNQPLKRDKSLLREFYEKTFLFGRESVSSSAEPSTDDASMQAEDVDPARAAGAQFADEPKEQAIDDFHGTPSVAPGSRKLADCIDAEIKRWGGMPRGKATVSDYQIFQEFCIPALSLGGKSQKKKEYAARIDLEPNTLTGRLKNIRKKTDDLIQFLDATPSERQQWAELATFAECISSAHPELGVLGGVGAMVEALRCLHQRPANPNPADSGGLCTT